MDAQPQGLARRIRSPCHHGGLQFTGQQLHDAARRGAKLTCARDHAREAQAERERRANSPFVLEMRLGRVTQRAELVRHAARDEGEIREWIRDGSPRRLRDNPVAAFFLRRQAIRMPAFGDRASEEDVARIVAYIRWLRGPVPSRVP